jgi:hypothetical protein
MDLGTTNLLLGILAVCSAIEVLALIGAGIGGFIAYRRVMQLVNGLEQRQVAPAMARVNTILDDVKGVTSRVSEEAERMDHAIRETIERVDETADRVRVRVRSRANRFIGVLRGVRTAIEVFLNREAEAGQRPPAQAPGRA